MTTGVKHYLAEKKHPLLYIIHFHLALLFPFFPIFLSKVTRQQYIDTTRHICHPSGSPHGGKNTALQKFPSFTGAFPRIKQPLIPRGHPLNAAPGHEPPFRRLQDWSLLTSFLLLSLTACPAKPTATETVWVIPLFFSQLLMYAHPESFHKVLPPLPCQFRGSHLHLFQQVLQSPLPYDDKHDQRVSHQADNKDHRVDSSDDDGDGRRDAGVVVLGIPEDPGSIAVIVCPAQEPAAAGAGGTTGPRGAGGVQLFPENLHRSTHRGRRETCRRVQTAGGEYPGEREEGKKQKCYHRHQTLGPLQLVCIKGALLEWEL